jgi:hypothetical protein
MLNEESIIREGYFPKELPPFFTTEIFASKCLVIPSNVLPPDSYITSGAVHCISKTKNHRRYLVTPNPANYLRLVKEIIKNLSDLNSIIQSSPISIFAKIAKNNSNIIHSDEIFTDLDIYQIEASFGKRFLLYVDIQNFYPSIYTHSIPWIIHGKEKMKLPKNRGNNFYGNVLDKLIRNSQDAETYGLPIGPYTSYFISEIVNSRIDKEITDKFPDLKGVRVFDDRYFYLDNKDTLNKVLKELNTICKKYNLELNSTKTKIIDLPEVYSEDWLNRIRSYNIRDNVNQKKDLTGFFSVVFELAKNNPNKSVIQYALGKVDKSSVNGDNWNIFYKLLITSALYEPQALPKVITIISNYLQKDSYKINKVELKKIIISNLNYFIEHLHTNEIIWFLHLTRICKIDLPSTIGKKISKIEDSFIATLAVVMSEEKLLNGINNKIWQNYLNDNGLKTNMWLFSYEAGLRKWNTTGEYINNDKFFKYLKDSKISFIETNQTNIKTTRISKGKY